MKKIIEQEGNKINLYRIQLKKGINAISYTNIIFYDNVNKTLPLGQDLSTNVLIDVSKLNLNLIRKAEFNIVQFENKNDDFSNINIKHVKVYEF